MIITLYYITLTLQIMLINVIYLDISVSNIIIPHPKGMDCMHVYARSQSEPALQHRIIPARLPNAMLYSIMFVWFSHIKQVQIV